MSLPVQAQDLGLRGRCLNAGLHQIAVDPKQLARQLVWPSSLDDSSVPLDEEPMMHEGPSWRCQRPQAPAASARHKWMSLSPVTTETKTGKRRVIEYLRSPVHEALGENLGER